MNEKVNPNVIEPRPVGFAPLEGLVVGLLGVEPDPSVGESRKVVHVVDDHTAYFGRPVPSM